MNNHITFQHEFVESFPETLEQRVLYISMPYSTATHQCACGCGNEVVTPFSPTDWQLHFDGVSISLTPSIGNWNTSPAVRTTSSARTGSSGHANGLKQRSKLAAHTIAKRKSSTLDKITTPKHPQKPIASDDGKSSDNASCE
jgi:hypothetical protein